MRYVYGFLLLGAAWGCQEKPLNEASDLRASMDRLEELHSQLTQRVAELETELANTKQALTTAQEALTSTQGAVAGLVEKEPTLDKAAELFTYVSVDDDGDVVLEGTNLHLRSGNTDSTMLTGKGNLIVGYNRSPKYDYCSTDGLQCVFGHECPDGECVDGYSNPRELARQGEHNIVVGNGHQYAGRDSLLVGVDNTTRGVGNVIFGARNASIGSEAATVVGGKYGIASGDYSSVSGGLYNIAGGEGSSVSGGTYNNAARHYSVISGGSHQETVVGGVYSYLPWCTCN